MVAARALHRAEDGAAFRFDATGDLAHIETILRPLVAGGVGESQQQSRQQSRVLFQLADSQLFGRIGTAVPKRGFAAATGESPSP